MKNHENTKKSNIFMKYSFSCTQRSTRKFIREYVKKYLSGFVFCPRIL